MLTRLFSSWESGVWERYCPYQKGQLKIDFFVSFPGSVVMHMESHGARLLSFVYHTEVHQMPDTFDCYPASAFWKPVAQLSKNITLTMWLASLWFWKLAVNTCRELVKLSFMHLLFFSWPVNSSRHLPRTIQCIHLENYKFVVSIFQLLGWSLHSC